jgi:hypothetical protein
VIFETRYINIPLWILFIFRGGLPDERQDVSALNPSATALNFKWYLNIRRKVPTLSSTACMFPADCSNRKRLFAPLRFHSPSSPRNVNWWLFTRQRKVLTALYAGQISPPARYRAITCQSITFSWLTTSTGLSPSRGPASRAITKIFTAILWNPNLWIVTHRLYFYCQLLSG